FGNRIAGSKRTSPAGAPDGYNATSFQLTTARFGPVEAPAEKPLGGAVARKSALASIEVTPGGISRWNVNIFTSSRRQGMSLPLAVNFRPARLSIGPVGPCSPGIHCG